MIKIRKGQKEDLPEILNLIKELAEYENSLNQVSVTVEQLENDGFGNNPAFYFLVAQKNDEIIGMSFYWIRPKRYRDISNSSRMGMDLSIPDGKFHEVYRSSGALSAPVFDGGNIYTSSKSGYVIAIDQASYEKKWSFDNGGPIDFAPLVAGNQVYWGLRDGSVRSVDRKSTRLNSSHW